MRMSGTRVLGSLVLAGTTLTLCAGASNAVAGPTTGWTDTAWTYTIHKPWNKNVSDRFKYTGGVWYTWVYESDVCFQDPCSATDGRRTELRWNNNYTSGNHMMEASIYMVPGTNEATVMQIFGGATSATGYQVRGFTENGGTYKHYGSEVLAAGVNSKFTNIKLMHDANANTVKAYVADVLIRTDADHGDATHYFKCGVYVGDISSAYSETRFNRLKHWTK